MEDFVVLGTLIRKSRIAQILEPADVIALMSIPISQTYYLKIEANTIIPGPKVLEQICLALNISHDDAYKALARVKRPRKFYPSKKVFIDIPL